MARLDGALTPGGLQRRNAIINAAAQLFNEHGYHNTSTAQIAERVGCAKATVYHYFKKKPEILFEIHDQWIEELLTRVEERDPGLSLEEFLRSVFRDILHLMESKSDNVRVFFEYYHELPSDLRATAVAKRDRYEALILNRIEHGVRTGELKARQPRIAAFALFGMCNWAYQWYRPGRELSDEQVADELFSIYFDGLGAAPSAG
ncbi:TetR family transcriptional regulator [Leucobacter weissii]|uniref:TetR family transcriptional regulator n=1 Tax=Leucobacter weissii TaxID=1983706 RepID=A0A939SBN3_9MICO|nr:TetR/AcrR family transcriptional regulator [Leucobacter weissii]MBO1901543.1 TetR family transcriptional regulator [Leucobacter weissii]